jgi:hypothetical protein
VGIADLRRELDRPIQQLRMWDDLRDQTRRLGASRIDDPADSRRAIPAPTT